MPELGILLISLEMTKHSSLQEILFMNQIISHCLDFQNTYYKQIGKDLINMCHETGTHFLNKRFPGDKSGEKHVVQLMVKVQ